MPADALNILVVDSQPATALGMIDMLRDSGHRAEVQNSGAGGLNAVSTKRKANRAYQLVLANFELADMDPVDFLNNLRQNGETLPVCFYAHTHKLPREAFSAVEQLDGRFIPMPVDRARLDTLIGDAQRGTFRRSTNADDSMFFGTGRMTRRSSSVTDSIPARPITGAHTYYDGPAAPAAPVAPVAPTAPTSRPISETIPKHAPPLPPMEDLPPVTTSISRRSSDAAGPAISVSNNPFPDDDEPAASARPPTGVLRGTAQFHNNPQQKQAPSTNSYQRTPMPGSITSSGDSGDPFALVPRAKSLTERHRRSITTTQQAPAGSQPPATDDQQAAVDPKPGTGTYGGTSRIRRSITGKTVNTVVTAQPQPTPEQQAMTSTGQARVATCVACNKEFYAELRVEPYTLPCVYCGQVNRIDPA